jgi:hypothetical protein
MPVIDLFHQRVALISAPVFTILFIHGSRESSANGEGSGVDEFNEQTPVFETSLRILLGVASWCTSLMKLSTRAMRIAWSFPPGRPFIIFLIRFPCWFLNAVFDKEAIPISNIGIR